MERPQIRYARAKDGAHVAYMAFGTGSFDILLVPGQISHLDLQWDDPVDGAFLRRLGTFGRVIALDRRGVGLSDRLSPGDLPPIEVLVEDLGAVLDAAGASSPVLFGCADGGQLASLFAAVHPDRLHGLIVYGMWSHVRTEDRPEWERWIDWATERWGTEELAIRDARETAPSRAGDARAIDYVGRVQRTALSPAAVRPLFRISLDLDVRDVLPTVAVPTLALYRPQDSATSGELLRSTAALFRDATVIELPGIDHWWSAEPQDPLFDAVEGFLARLGGALRPSLRRLATVLFTDIVDSTALASEVGDGVWRATVAEHHRVVRRELDRFGGTEVDTAGDGFFATFDGPARAARCAMAIEAAVHELAIRVRAGVHTGEVESIDNKIGGLGVLIGARVGALAGPDEVLVTSTVKDLTAGSGLAFEDAGEHELKGIPDRWHLYRVMG